MVKTCRSLAPLERSPFGFVLCRWQSHSFSEVLQDLLFLTEILPSFLSAVCHLHFSLFPSFLNSCLFVSPLGEQTQDCYIWLLGTGGRGVEKGRCEAGGDKVSGSLLQAPGTLLVSPQMSVECNFQLLVLTLFHFYVIVCSRLCFVNLCKKCPLTFLLNWGAYLLKCEDK